MLKGVTNKSEIKKLQNQLEAKLKDYSTERILVKYSSKAGVSQEVKAYYSEDHELWWYFDGNNTQYYNPFGMGKRKNHQPITGRCQFNMPKDGYNGRIGATFAHDDEGNVFLMHNGGIGGGVPGVSKKTFVAWFTGELFEVDFGDKKAEYYIVSDFSSPHFMEDIKFFVEKVYAFKDFNRRLTNPTPNPREDDKWLEYGESVLRNPFLLPARTVVRGADHARITNELMRSLTALGYNVRRNRFMDAFIVDKHDKLSHLFEVKHMLDTQSLYTAIGQLMMYGLNHQTKLFLVIDENTRPNLLKDLKELGIHCLTFAWVKNQPIFKNIKNVL